jgi:exopolysaccharide biosynthesis polyprenyl glycosylphosphotransferase
VVDAALFCLAYWLAHHVRSTWFDHLEPLSGFEHYIWLWPVIFFSAIVILAWLRYYDRPLLYSRRQFTWTLLKGSLWIMLAAMVIMVLLKQQLARSIFPVSALFGFLMVLAKEEVTRRFYHSRMGQAQLKKRVVLVGVEQETLDLRQRIIAQSRGSLHIVAQVDLNECGIPKLAQLLHEHSANGVIINAHHTYFDLIEEVIRCCEIEGIETWVVADFFRTQTFRLTADDLHGLPVLVFRSAPEENWQVLGKKTLDFLGSLLGLILLSPFLAAIAFVIRWTSPGPILFRQQRCGLNGQPFNMLKFRSMVTDAEQRQHELAALNEMTGPVFKVTNDPRITPIGRVLRKYSMDELPQLFNVLCGDMSLVGPRPLPVKEVNLFDDYAHRRRLSVKPGLTCLWQISGRNNLTNFKEWIRLDLEYIDNWSLWLDVKILFRTIPVVLMGSGAK